MWKHARGRRVPIALTVAAVAAASGIAFATGPTAHAAAGCQVTYQANQWTGGFTANIRVTAGDAVNGWTVTWTYGGDQRVSNAWNAVVTQSGSAVTARNVAWNGQLAAGGTTEFGLQGTFGSANPAPTGFALNGVACNGAPTTSAPVPSSPAPSSAAPSSPAPSSPAPSSPAPSSPAPTSAAPSSAAPSSPAASVPPAAGCGAAAFCDGFEDQAGSTPSGSWGVVYPDCQGTGTASVDAAVAHTGRRSVKISGTAGYCNHVFVTATRDLSTLGAVRYGRFWVRHTTALPSQHVTFLAMRDANDGGRDLRMGGQNGALQWNRGSDDATLPEQSPSGVALSLPLPTDRWTCVEFLVDGNQGRLQTWVDGTSVAGLQADGTPTHDIDGQWTKPTWKPNLTDLKLGWESYGEGSDTLWFDDVAMGSSRIGC